MIKIYEREREKMHAKREGGGIERESEWEKDGHREKRKEMQREKDVCRGNKERRKGWREKDKDECRDTERRGRDGWLVGFYGISTFQTIQFSISIDLVYT